MKKSLIPLILFCLWIVVGCTNDPNAHLTSRNFQGKWIEGDGDHNTLNLIDKAFESMQVSSEMASLPLLYKRDWDGFVEGHYWGGWWIQNSFGPTFGMLPFLGAEPYRTWIRHSQGLWFNMMGNDIKAGRNGYIAPDGSLMDCAMIYFNGSAEDGFGARKRPGRMKAFDGSIDLETPIYRQGDGNTKEYDWYIGGAAAGIIMEAERLLVGRNPDEITTRFPQLKRVAAFLDSRRDEKINLLKGGRSSNLLAPSFGGVKQPDGTYATAYLTELSVNYCGALKRLIALCEIAGDLDARDKFSEILSSVRKALAQLMENDDYYIRYMVDDGTRHGVFGADLYGYFEATPNHDAVAMGVADDISAKKIVQKMLSIPELAPHDFILPNHPAYDDLDNPTVLEHLPPGMWVDGGFWSTTQGRMNIACLRVNEFDHPLKAWEKQLKFMQAFRAGAPMKDYGQKLWDDKIKKYGYNIVYDCWGVPGGLVRGLFEYDYMQTGLWIRPHIPPGITRYIQKQPVWYGRTKIYLTVNGTGKPKMAIANGQSCKINEEGWIILKPEGEPRNLCVEIVCESSQVSGAWKPYPASSLELPEDQDFWAVEGFISPVYKHVNLKVMYNFYKEMEQAALSETYEGAMSRLVLEHILARYNRVKGLEADCILIPRIEGTPAAIEDEINDRFVIQARFLSGGLLDHLTGVSYWKEEVDPRVLKIARQCGLISYE